MHDPLSTNDLDALARRAGDAASHRLRRAGKAKASESDHACSCQGTCGKCQGHSQPMKTIEVAPVEDRIAAIKARMASRRAGAVHADPKTGKIASKRSKTGDPVCSQAMSNWKLHGMSPSIAATLGRCRSMARQSKLAEGTRLAGNEARAQHLEHRVKQAAESGGPITVKERLEAARAARIKRKSDLTERADRQADYLQSERNIHLNRQTPTGKIKQGREGDASDITARFPAQQERARKLLERAKGHGGQPRATLEYIDKPLPSRANVLAAQARNRGDLAEAKRLERHTTKPATPAIATSKSPTGPAPSPSMTKEQYLVRQGDNAALSRAQAAMVQRAKAARPEVEKEMDAWRAAERAKAAVLEKEMAGRKVAAKPAKAPKAPKPEFKLRRESATSNREPGVLRKETWTKEDFDKAKRAVEHPLVPADKKQAYEPLIRDYERVQDQLGRMKRDQRQATNLRAGRTAEETAKRIDTADRVKSARDLLAFRSKQSSRQSDEDGPVHVKPHEKQDMARSFSHDYGPALSKARSVVQKLKDRREAAAKEIRQREAADYFKHVEARAQAQEAAEAAARAIKPVSPKIAAPTPAASPIPWKQAEAKYKDEAASLREMGRKNYQGYEIKLREIQQRMKADYDSRLKTRGSPERLEKAADLRRAQVGNRVVRQQDKRDSLIKKLTGSKTSNRSTLTTEQRQKAAAGLREYHAKILATPSKQRKTAEQAERAESRFFAKRPLIGPKSYSTTPPAPATPTPTLREQAAAHRAGKGTAAERIDSLLQRARAHKQAKTEALEKRRIERARDRAKLSNQAMTDAYADQYWRMSNQERRAARRVERVHATALATRGTQSRIAVGKKLKTVHSGSLEDAASAMGGLVNKYPQQGIAAGTGIAILPSGAGRWRVLTRKQAADSIRTGLRQQRAHRAAQA
ncbi:MAG: hypothetical protein AB7G11_02655 [Phycisphaerales bacterium]